jgi:hypothetical protein
VLWGIVCHDKVDQRLLAVIKKKAKKQRPFSKECNDIL